MADRFSTSTEGAAGVGWRRASRLARGRDAGWLRQLMASPPRSEGSGLARMTGRLSASPESVGLARTTSGLSASPEGVGARTRVRVQVVGSRVDS